MRVMRRYCVGFLWGMLFCIMGCSEPAREVMGTTTDGAFELVLRADPNWVRPNGRLPVEVVLRRLKPLAQLGLNDRIVLVSSTGTASPASVIPTFVPAQGDTIEKQVFQTWVEFQAPGISFAGPTGEQQGELHAFFRSVKATLKVRIVPFLGE